MTKLPEDATTSAAIRLLRDKHKVRDLIVVGIDDDQAGGNPVYRVHAVSEAAPNDASYTVVVDAAGAEVDAEELSKREGKELFAQQEPVMAVAGDSAGLPRAAVTIEPAENDLTLNPGDTFAETITVKIPRSGTSSLADVYFLADTSGSMKPILDAVQAGANNVLTALNGLGVDICFGVGNYKDFQRPQRDPYIFQHQQSLTNVADAVTSAISAWSAGGGQDRPEAQLYALHKLAEPADGQIGWRAGAKKFIVWFGDSPGHDPICAAISGEAAAITEASVTAKLASAGITVLAISVLAPGLDGNPRAGAIDYLPVCGEPEGLAGQATRIATATGGRSVSGINAGNIVNTIISLVTTAASATNNVKLVPAGSIVPFVGSITPADGYGPLLGDQEHTLRFEVIFRGQALFTDQGQVFAGTLDVIADGRVVASKLVRITQRRSKMEELFRFFLTRPAQRIDAARTEAVRPADDYYSQLKKARASDEPRTALNQVALAYSQSDQALKSTGELTYAGPLEQLSNTLTSARDLSRQQHESAQESQDDYLEELVQKLFGVSAKELVKNQQLGQDRGRLSDTLVTNAILSGDGAVSTYDAARYLRAIAIVERVAKDDTTLNSEEGIADALDRLLVLPADIFPISHARTDVEVPPTKQPGDEASKKRAALREQRDSVLATYTMLTRINPEDLVAPVETTDGHTTTDAGVPPTAAAGPGKPPGAANAAQAPAKLAEVSGRRSAPLLLKPEATAAFQPADQAVLAARRLDLNRISLATAADRLSAELQTVEIQLARLEDPDAQQMVLVGTSYLPVQTAVAGVPAAGAMSVPTTRGTVAPAGVGDLLVVRQFLKRYEARELAHVENILKGEYKERVHRRARTTEETITVETESRSEEERDQQTTERFELKRESSEVLKQDMSLKVGLAVSGKYGPVVEFKATTDFALNTSKEEATKVATSYSKDVTSRATSKIFERRREERILKTIEVFEETNTHGVDNKGGTGHVVGQYQWLEKVYEAQVFNYGKRLLFDIMLPEPAAFLLHALGNRPKAGVDLVKPVPFTLLPTDISEWNYALYMSRYEAAGVTPPPQPYTTVAKAVEGTGSEDNGVTKVLEIPLPEGYQAVGYEWQSRSNRWDDGDVTVVVLPEPINNKVGTIVLTVKTWKVEAFTVALAIHCQRTPRALDEWKLKTHTAILQAYQKQLRDYEEKLAALEVQAAQEIQGRNPVENEQLIRSELKKGAISVFTAQHYDLFGAISVSPQGFPQPNLLEAAAEGKYIRFFEQAFEWEQMMFFFYPYFWGRKPNWVNRSLLQDTDPAFAEFIKAGSARIVVSVRPGFERAIAHFLDTGETWDGGDLPAITSPLYVSIIEEIRERDKAPGDEIAQGEPWDVHLPTTLIKLRDAATLPQWQKNPQGEWVPV
jgi:hypothetical protein